jgi:hypothetical protein
MKFYEFETHYDINHRELERMGLTVSHRKKYVRGKKRKLTTVKCTVNDVVFHLHERLADYYLPLQRSTALTNDQTMHNQFALEMLWYGHNKPYYNIWPKIIPMFLKLKLDKVDSSQVRVPIPVLLMRMPVDDNPLTFEWNSKVWPVKSMLVSYVSLGVDKNKHLVDRIIKLDKDGIQQVGMTIWMDVGEKMDGQTIYTYRNFPLMHNVSVEESIHKLPREPYADIGVQVPQEMWQACIRLVCMVCMLDKADDLIEQDVVSGKSNKRGNRGWSIGRGIEVSPHLRNAHPCLVWYGPGKKLSKVITRRRSIIHREKVEKIPTGYSFEPPDDN